MIYPIITTAPRRNPTLDIAVNSLGDAGFDLQRTMIFAEPGAYLGCLPWSEGGPTVIHRPFKFGCWLNYFHALRDMTRGMRFLGLSESHILMIQDDTILTKGIVSLIAEKCASWEPRDLISLLTRPRDAFPQLAPGSGAVQFSEVNLDQKWGYCGAHCIIWPLAAAERFVSDPKVEAYRGMGVCKPEDARNIDTVIGDWCSRTRTSIWTPQPSLADHIGETSTITNKKLTRWRRAHNFIESLEQAASARTAQ